MSASVTTRGTVDDLGAQISITVGNATGGTNTTDALIERNGHWWVENLPLSSRTDSVAGELR